MTARTLLIELTEGPDGKWTGTVVPEGFAVPANTSRQLGRGAQDPSIIVDDDESLLHYPSWHRFCRLVQAIAHASFPGYSKESAAKRIREVLLNSPRLDPKSSRYSVPSAGNGAALFRALGPDTYKRADPRFPKEGFVNKRGARVVPAISNEKKCDVLYDALLETYTTIGLPRS